MVKQLFKLRLAYDKQGFDMFFKPWQINSIRELWSKGEGLYVSEWVRKLITNELSEHGMLDKGLFVPKGTSLGDD